MQMPDCKRLEKRMVLHDKLEKVHRSFWAEEERVIVLSG